MAKADSGLCTLSAVFHDNLSRKQIGEQSLRFGPLPGRQRRLLASYLTSEAVADAAIALTTILSWVLFTCIGNLKVSSFPGAGMVLEIRRRNAAAEPDLDAHLKGSHAVKKFVHEACHCSNHEKRW